MARHRAGGSLRGRSRRGARAASTSVAARSCVVEALGRRRCANSASPRCARRLFALRAARALCALEGRTNRRGSRRRAGGEPDACAARDPDPGSGEEAGADGDEAKPEARADAGPDDERSSNSERRDAEKLEDVILAAAKAAIPAGLLARIAARPAPTAAKSAGEGGRWRRQDFGPPRPADRRAPGLSSGGAPQSRLDAARRSAMAAAAPARVGPARDRAEGSRSA